MLIKQTRPLQLLRGPSVLWGTPGWLAGLGPQDTENPERQRDGQGDPQREQKGCRTGKGWLLEFAGISM